MGTLQPNNTAQQAHTMGKKDKKRSADEAGLVAVEAGASSAAGVGLPVADEGETTTMDVDTSTAGEPTKKKKKSSKKDKDGAAAADKSSSKKEKEKELEIPADALSPIAHPLAGKKLSKKVLKTVKKAARARHVKRGVKEVVKSLRKGEKGMVVMAADISPMDILTHVPLLAEESACPYVFVTSKELLGQASSTKRPTSCVMICPNSKRKARKPKNDAQGNPVAAKEPEEYKEAYEECVKEVNELDNKIEY